MIIPALDILQNRIVRLYQGKYDTAQFYPYDLAERLVEYQSDGAFKVHLVDLEGARDPAKKQWQQIQNACRELNIPYQVGGGIRNKKDVGDWLAAGAAQVVIGSAAVERRDEVAEWINTFGPEKFVLALDVNRVGENWVPATHGWLASAEFGLFELIDFYSSLGVSAFLCTDIGKDGTLSGPSFALYQDILTRFPAVELQASGGVSSLDDIKRLTELGVCGIILGKSLLDGVFTLKEALDVV